MHDPLHTTAIHESGHAIAAARLGCRPLSLSLDHAGIEAGRVMFTPLRTTNTNDARRMMRVYLAGVAAERIAFNEPRQPIGPDGAESWTIARVIHGLDADPETIDAEVNTQLAEVESLLRSHWPAVMDLADASQQWFAALDRFRVGIMEHDPIEIETVTPPLRIAASPSSKGFSNGKERR